jgi:hypothetical protein
MSRAFGAGFSVASGVSNLAAALSVAVEICKGRRDMATSVLSERKVFADLIGQICDSAKAIWRTPLPVSRDSFGVG